MDKQEKYINYIVEGLVSKSDIKDTSWLVFLDFIVEVDIIDYEMYDYDYDDFIYLWNGFQEYIIDFYGVREDEVENIWDLYRYRIDEKYGDLIR